MRSDHPQPDPFADALARELNEQLVSRFGPLLSSAVLVKALGYPSAQAYRQAIARDTLPVPVFRIEHRRGKFALARDVALWLCQQQRSVTARHRVSDATAPDGLRGAEPPELTGPRTREANMMDP